MATHLFEQAASGWPDPFRIRHREDGNGRAPGRVSSGFAQKSEDPMKRSLLDRHDAGHDPHDCGGDNNVQ